jgi:hypothetical protein
MLFFSGNLLASETQHDICIHILHLYNNTCEIVTGKSVSKRCYNVCQIVNIGILCLQLNLIGSSSIKIQVQWENISFREVFQFPTQWN